MGQLRVRHRVPFLGGSGTNLPFDCWIPGADDAAIRFIRDRTEVLVWVDRTCVDTFGHPATDEEIAKWQNIRVTSLLVEVIVQDVDDDLGAFILEKEQWPRGEDIVHSADPATRELAERYAELGREVMAMLLHATNRIVGWAYSEKGVFWLSTRDETKSRVQSDNNGFDARATFDGSPLVRWCPPVEDDPVELFMYNVSVTPKDWESARDFVSSDRRPDLVGELLANSQAQLNEGRARGAVVEAVSALEVAVARFMGSPLESALRADRPFNAPNFSGNLKHLGFNASVQHLLPLVLPSDVLSAEAHGAACAAIDCRHAIVHGRQRTVDLRTARRHVYAAVRLAALLKAATAPD